MKKSSRLIGTVLACTFVLSLRIAQAQVTQNHETVHPPPATGEFKLSVLLSQVRPGRKRGFSLMAEPASTVSGVSPMAVGPNLIVSGSGSLNRLTKWTGFSSSNSVIGNSTIYEDKFGLVGIGTDSPSSRLTVAGMIQTLSGGVTFPDGTVQTTSATGAFFSIPHDATLTGNGTAASPLGVALPLSLIGNVFSHVLTVQNLRDDGAGSAMLVSAGPGAVGITVGGGSQSSGNAGWGIDARGGHNSTGNFDGGIGVRAVGGSSPGTGGPGVDASGGGTSPGGKAGAGLRASGGNEGNPASTPGIGVEAEGGFGGFNGAGGVKATGGHGGNQGGPGVEAAGGEGDAGKGGDGLRATGGSSSDSIGGLGVFGRGGNSSDQTGGHGVSAQGGDSDTEVGGHGITATGGSGPMGDGLAGKFNGDVEITGNLNVTGATKNFKIDHPLDPENKYLYHAAIESSEALNVYSGNVITDAKGNAVVSLPGWFEALNRDLRYQLTVIGTFAQAIVAEKVRNNHFIIRTSAPRVEVSWQVTGIRSDRAMLKHPFKAEEDKPERERGYYLHPELYNKPAERNVERARNPRPAREPKASRELASRTHPRQR